MGFITITEQCPGVVNHLNERLGMMKEKNPLIFPDLSKGESIFSVSDYSGENKSTFFQALSFLIVDWNNADLWDAARTAFRYNKLDFERHMEYKKLNKDKERRRLLEEFLSCFDCVNGISVTFLIHRAIRYMFTEKSPHTLLEKEGLGSWKPHIAEKILRVTHFQAPLIYGLTHQGQKFLWLTDRDAITKDIEKLGDIYKRVFDIYATHEFDTFAYAEPFVDDTKRIDDLLAIPDLVAAAILEYYNKAEKTQLTNQADFQIQEKANTILEWVANNKSSLKKLVCLIRSIDNAWSFSFVNFDRK